MITYRDRTFCTGEGCKHFSDCPRALTDRVKEDAERWWKKPGAPIATFTEPKELECYEQCTRKMP